MKTIVVATDGSPAAHEAVELGIELAGPLEAKVVFTHVLAGVDWSDEGHGTPRHPVTPETQEALDGALALAEEAGVDAHVELIVGEGHVADELVEFAERAEADLIVVGSRGLGAIAGTFLGSVSRHVLHEARQPVLVARRTRQPAAKDD
jgi:nucleotide-binding universal stress UspA family protein